MSPVAGGVVVVGSVVVLVAVVPARSVFVVLASAFVPFAASFASARAAFVVDAFVVAGDVVLVFPVALAVVVFGPLEVEPAVVFGPEVFGPPCVVRGDETFVVFADTCCGFGVDLPLPCAETAADVPTINATAETSAIIVRVMNPPRGIAPITGELQVPFQTSARAKLFCYVS